MDRLALFGGRPTIRGELPPYRSMGAREARAVQAVVRSQCLSGFYGSAGKEFLGGPKVRELEEAWGRRFNVHHAVSVNSATSGLFAAMGAVGVSPGDEVIVPPYTMSATAMAPLVYGGIPVFADIDPDTFCIDPDAVRRLITKRTRAILAVNLFGHPAPLAELRAISRKHGLALVEDNAQGPLAQERGRYAGTIGDIGVFSLNYHKHIHTGEGGMCVTNDKNLAVRLQLIRNHAEAVVEDYGVRDLTNLVGFNYRMTELSAAVGIEQLKRAEAHVAARERACIRLSEATADLEGLTPPRVRPGCRHVYYVWAMRINERTLGVSRARFSQALAAEGFPHGCGYVRPLYRLPIFRRRRAFGRNGYPFRLGRTNYRDGICPVVERMHERELLMFEPCRYDLGTRQVDALIHALRKVHAQRHALAGA